MQIITKEVSMSYNKIQQWFGFFNNKIKNIKISYGGLTIELERTLKKKLKCPVCKSTDISLYGSTPRILRDLTISKRRVYVLLRQSRIYCSNCGVHNERLSFVDPYAHHTRRFERYIHQLCRFLTITEVAELFQLKWDEVKLIDQKYLHKKYKKRNKLWRKLRKIGVDEIALKKGHKYLTVIVNLETGQVIHIGKDRKKETLEEFFYLIGPKRCSKINAIVMDMWEPYISAAKKMLPKAQIVFDKFHIISSYNKIINIIRRHEYACASREDRTVMKGTRFLLVKNESNLSMNEKGKLFKLLSINTNLNLAHILKDDLQQLWQCSDKEEAELFLNSWTQRAYLSRIPALETFANTLMRYKNGIINYYNYPITSAQVEGINNKIKVLKRKVYGFGDMDYFALKIFDLKNISFGFV